MTKKKTSSPQKIKTTECRMVFDFELPSEDVQLELDSYVKAIRDWLNEEGHHCNYHSQRILRSSYYE